MQAGKEGAALIALRSGATIVPVGVVGTHRVKEHWFSFKRAPVQLSVGKPFCVRPRPANGRRQRADLAAITHEMMYRVAIELPAEFRGVYGDLERATLAHLLPLEN
jgi:1-acyl-sn-glycerol-3-phosphate acyltransferase